MAPTAPPPRKTDSQAKSTSSRAADQGFPGSPRLCILAAGQVQTDPAEVFPSSQARGFRRQIRGPRSGTPWARTSAASAKLANLSLRQLAELTSLSNPYLSQIERGQCMQPSVRVLKLLSGALNVSAETLLAEAGLLDPDSSAVLATAADPGSGLSLPDVEAAIRADSPAWPRPAGRLDHR